MWCTPPSRNKRWRTSTTTIGCSGGGGVHDRGVNLRTDGWYLDTLTTTNTYPHLHARVSPGAVHQLDMRPHCGAVGNSQDEATACPLHTYSRCVRDGHHSNVLSIYGFSSGITNAVGKFGGNNRGREGGGEIRKTTTYSSATSST